MDESIKQKNGITEGVIWKQLLIFFFPMLFGAFFQQLYNTADAIVVGRFVGKEALSGVGGTTGSLINLFVGFFIGISTGGTITLAQYYGGKKDGEVSKTVHTAYALSIVGGLIIMIAGFLGAPYLLRLMGTPEDIIPYSLMYLRIYFLGMIPNLLYNIGTGILRAIGDSRSPLYYLIISCMVNIVLDLLFVVVFHWDVAGVAIATVISQICSAILITLKLMKATDSYKLEPKQIRFHKDIVKKIIAIGLPAGFQSLMYTSSNVLIQSNVNSFGTDTVAAWTAYGKIDGVFWMTISSFGTSITTFVGQNFGAGKMDRVKKGIRSCFLMMMGTSLVMSFLLYHFGDLIYLLFTKEKIVIDLGIQILQNLVPFYVTYICIELFSGTLRAMGDAFMPMLISLFGICVLRFIWLYTAVPVWRDIKTVIASYPITWIITSILFIVYYFVRRKKLSERYVA